MRVEDEIAAAMRERHGGGESLVGALGARRDSRSPVIPWLRGVAEIF